MPHNRYPFSFSTVSDWSVPSSAALRELDQGASESIDGDAGGLWSPATPIAIGGSGVHVNSYGQFTGKVATGRRGEGLILGDDDFPQLDVPRSRTVVVPIRDTTWRVDDNTLDFERSYLETIGKTQFLAAHDENIIGGLISSKYLVSGATISSATLRYAVGFKPDALPDSMLGFRLFRMPHNAHYTASGNDLYLYPTWQATTAYAIGDVVLPTSRNGFKFRCVATSGTGITGTLEPDEFSDAPAIGSTIVDGFINAVTWQTEDGPGADSPTHFTVPRPWDYASPYGSTVDRYFAFGRPQVFEMVPNANNVIDTSLYQYGYEVYDASLTQNIMLSLSITITGIVDMRPAG